MLRFMLPTATILALAAAPAAALTTYGWSFQNETGVFGGAISGTVSGSVTLPDGDGVFAASDFVVETVPTAVSDAYLVAFGTSFPTDISLFSEGFISNSFTVAGGAIDLSATDFFGLVNGNTAIALNSIVGGTASRYSFIDLPNAGDLGATGVRDTTSASLSFTGGSTPGAEVPLPAAAPLLLVGAVALAAAARRRRSR